MMMIMIMMMIVNDEYDYVCMMMRRMIIRMWMMTLMIICNDEDDDIDFDDYDIDHNDHDDNISTSLYYLLINNYAIDNHRDIDSDTDAICKDRRQAIKMDQIRRKLKATATDCAMKLRDLVWKHTCASSSTAYDRDADHHHNDHDDDDDDHDDDSNSSDASRIDSSLSSSAAARRRGIEPVSSCYGQSEDSTAMPCCCVHRNFLSLFSRMSCTNLLCTKLLKECT